MVAWRKPTFDLLSDSMTWVHVRAIFRAEYYTTTARFRAYRKWIPILFIGGVILFSLLLRSIYDVLRTDNTSNQPDIYPFYAIISVFTFFTLFAPILSPLGRIIYDGAAKSRREVALSSPIKSRDLLLGNLLSNLAFFLPFFALVGTLSLAPFIGNGEFNPIVTSLILSGVLSLIILIGLIAGTILSPLIFNSILKQRSDIAKAFVTFVISIFMILSLPLLKYLLDNVNSNEGAGLIGYLPFTLASSIIIYALYGVTIGISPLTATFGLLIYLFLFLIIGWKSANYLYDLTDEEIRKVTVNPEGKKYILINGLMQVVPKTVQNPTKLMLTASLRDIEHISRITLGIAITVFMTFALSSRGLFQSSPFFTENLEAAVLIFSLVISAASVVFIQISSFTVQHRDLFTLIKSAPEGSRKFIFAKIFQTSFIILPTYLILMLILFFNSQLSLILRINVIFIVFTTLITLITLSLAIYMVNPADNEEDLTNFINLLVFYVITFALSIIPTSLIIAEISIRWYHYVIYIGILAILSVISIKISIKSLDEMDLETLSSPQGDLIIHGAKSFALFATGWNVLPIFGLFALYFTSNILVTFGVIMIFTLTLPIVFWYYNVIPSPHGEQTISRNNALLTLKTLILMLLTGVIILLVVRLLSFAPPSNIFVVDPNSIQPTILIIVVLLLVVIEELFFRWFILDYSLKKLPAKYAYILNAILFGIIHLLTVFTALNAFIQAIFLCNLKVKSRSIVWPILAHFTYNIVILAPSLL
ncbi:MAG: CPBP family intramembrane metalloprotease [Candidatus Heimdallarchaeota archaeon]|nr:CPBP family intramembrane metalloprotease [Candidatus Heimdallarchaeota archaeon]